MKHAQLVIAKIRPTWDSASESVRAIYRKYALMALIAARKAVTGNE